MTTVLIRLVSLLAAASVTGCSQSPGPTMELESGITVCAPEAPDTAEAPCVSVPAADAEYVVLRDGEQVAEGRLSPSGRAVIEAEQGTYSVTVRMPELGLEASSGDVQQGPGPSATLSVQVQLPSTTVTATRAP